MSPETLLRLYDAGAYWPTGQGLESGDSLPEAYRIALAVRLLRQQRNEVPRGYKIGFTNRNIWSRYQVFAPIWGTVWDTTLAFCEGAGI